MDYIVFYFMKRPNISSEKNMQPTMIATVKIEHIISAINPPLLFFFSCSIYFTSFNTATKKPYIPRIEVFLYTVFLQLAIAEFPRGTHK